MQDGAAPGMVHEFDPDGIVRVTFNHFACWLNIESTMWMNAS
jgi:hypothetical protein